MSFINFDETVIAILWCPRCKVYSTSIYMVLSREGFGEGLQPSLSPILQIYDALKSSFVAVFADREAIADGLNPFTISHSAMTISCKNIGKFITKSIVEKGLMSWKMIKKPVIRCNVMAMKPQTDIQRGMSLD